MPGKMITVAEASAALPTDLRTLLLRVALLRRYDMSTTQAFGPSTHLTLNVPRELLEQIDAVLEQTT